MSKVLALQTLAASPLDPCFGSDISCNSTQSCYSHLSQAASQFALE